MISAADVDELTGRVRGPVLVPDTEGFAQEVTGFNLAGVARPNVVVGATGTEDVVAAMGWAGAHRCPVGVQATGHGADQAMEGGLLITTSRMQDLDVDPVHRTARVGAGVRWRNVLEATLPHGLIGLNGSSTDVGVVGYTLGGGLPILGRTFGWAADRILAAELVTPDGAVHRLDADHDPELFGLLRGGTGNLGIVTSLAFELVPLDGFYGGGIFYPGADAHQVLTAFSSWAPALPPQANTSVALLRLPDLPMVPDPLRGQFVVHLRFAWAGDPDQGAQALAPMREVSHPVLDTAAPMDYGEVDRIDMDPTEPVPLFHTGGFLADFGTDAVQDLLAVAGPGQDFPAVAVEVVQMGAAFSHPGQVPDAVHGRGADCFLGVVALLVPPVAESVPAAVEALLQAMAPHAPGGVFVNHYGFPDTEAERARAWPAEAYERLVQAKTALDPQNLLRFQHVVGQGHR